MRSFRPRIVFTAVLDEEPGHELLTTVTLVDENGKTRLTVRQTAPRSEAYARGQQQGWTESLERLAGYVAKA